MSAEDFPLPGQVGEQFFRFAEQSRNIGSLDNPSGRGSAIGQCGDSINIFLRIDNGTIADVKVLPNGCVYTQVCASAVSELAKGLTPDRALELEPEDVVKVLGGLPEDHLHCARLAVNTLGDAIADYYKKISESGSKKQAS